MGENILNFAASNFMADFRDTLRPYLLIFFALVGSVALGYAIYLGFLLARAEDNEKRKKAKKRILMTLSSLMIVIILATIFIDWDPGEVFDRDGIALGRASNYALEESVFMFQPNGKYPLKMSFRGVEMDNDYLEVTWSTPVFAGPPSKSASITFNGDAGNTGKWEFNYPGATPPDPTEAYHFIATLTVLVGGEVVTVNVPLAVLVYDPNYTSAPPPLRPQGEAHDTPLPQPGGGGGSDPGVGGDPGITNPGTGGDYDFAWAISGSPSHGKGWPISSPMSYANTTCAQCRANSTGRTGHTGVDVVGGGPIFAMQSGKVVAIVSSVTVASACPSNPLRSSGTCLNARGPGLNGHASGTAYGNVVVIRHEDANGNAIKINNLFVYSTYAHMVPKASCAALASLSQNSKVVKGQRIGTMGTTGHSTGIHMHWEMILSSNGSQSGTTSIAGTKVCPVSYY